MVDFDNSNKYAIFNNLSESDHISECFQDDSEHAQKDIEKDTESKIFLVSPKGIYEINLDQLSPSKE